MLSLLEHMYHELDLVQEFNMNPITLKRWLVSASKNLINFDFIILNVFLKRMFFISGFTLSTSKNKKESFKKLISKVEYTYSQHQRMLSKYTYATTYYTNHLWPESRKEIISSWSFVWYTSKSVILYTQNVWCHSKGQISTDMP